MKILMMDFLHWVFPKNNNSFIELLQEHGVEVKYIEPKYIYRNSRKIFVDHSHTVPDIYYRGFNLKNMIKVEMVKETHWYGWDKKVEDEYVIRLMGIIDWLYEIFEKEKPDYVLIEGGLIYFTRAIAEVARELGIKIITVENSFIDDKIFIDFHTGFICNRHEFARCSQDWMDTRYLTKERKTNVEKTIQKVFKTLKYRSKTTKLLPELKYPKTIFVPLQVCGDQVSVYDSKFNNEKFIKEILWLANNVFKDWNILLRCHPVEEKYDGCTYTGDWIQKQKLPENVHVLRGSFLSYSTQDLMRKSDLVFVNNSQAGLEACLMQKPVVVFGDAFYGNKGFTLQYKRTHNWKKIKETPQVLVKEDEMKLWFYYFHNWLFNKTFTETDKKRILKEFNING